MCKCDVCSFFLRRTAEHSSALATVPSVAFRYNTAAPYKLPLTGTDIASPSGIVVDLHSTLYVTGPSIYRYISLTNLSPLSSPNILVCLARFKKWCCRRNQVQSFLRLAVRLIVSPEGKGSFFASPTLFVTLSSSPCPLLLCAFFSHTTPTVLTEWTYSSATRVNVTLSHLKGSCITCVPPNGEDPVHL